MRATFILDASFLNHLQEFDQYWSRLNFKDPLAKTQTPFAGLDYLRRQGANIVLPNTILKEITFHQGRKQGLGMRQDGTPYLDTELLQDTAKHAQSIPFMGYLTDQAHLGTLVCFKTPEEYKDALEKNGLHGKLVIVADKPLTQGNGKEFTRGHGDYSHARRPHPIRTHSTKAHAREILPRPKVERGDHAIIRLLRILMPQEKLHDEERFHAPCAVLTTDAELGRSVYDRDSNHSHLIESPWLNGYLYMLSRLGFLPSESTLNTVCSEYVQHLQKTNPRVHLDDLKTSPARKGAIKQFLENTSILPIPVVQRFQLYHYTRLADKLESGKVV